MWTLPSPMRVRRIDAKAIAHGNFQYLLHKHLETAFYTRNPKLQKQAGGAEYVGAEHFHVGRRQAVDLGSFPHCEMNHLNPLVQGDIKHGILFCFGELHLLLLQGLDQWLDLVEIRFSSEQSHFLEVLREVQVRGSQEVEDVAENLPVSVDKAVALAIPLGGHLPTEHGTQHGIWEAGQGGERSGIQLPTNVQCYRLRHDRRRPQCQEQI
uniref:Uncharacterized protein n=1 Tax=Anolis carolinensis TaxID=28377 RepID=A0A803TX21_ANOCA